MKRKFYKTGWKSIINKNGKIQKVNYKPSNFKKKKSRENLKFEGKVWKSDSWEYDKKQKKYLSKFEGKVWKSDSWEYDKKQKKYLSVELELPFEPEKPKIQEYYRSVFTYLYQESKGRKRKEEIRIFIITETPCESEESINEVRDEFIENYLPDELSESFNNRCAGYELNNKLDEKPNKINEYQVNLIINNSIKMDWRKSK